MVPISEKDCSLVIPAYNEEQRISFFLEDAGNFGGTLIFVCDGDDKTTDIIMHFSDEHPDIDIKCLNFNRRLGKGGGVLEGIKAADTPFVGFVDADGSTSVSEMFRLFCNLSDSDCAVGSRWLSASEIVVGQSLWRKFQSRIFNLAVRLLFGLKISDTQCGAKVFKKEAVCAVLPSLVSRGFEFDVELLWRLNEMGFHIEEVPIVWEDRANSRVGSSDGLGMLYALIRIRFGV